MYPPILSITSWFSLSYHKSKSSSTPKTTAAKEKTSRPGVPFDPNIIFLHVGKKGCHPN
jgi:hypothetical protein